MIFAVISNLLYLIPYRNSFSDLKDLFRYYVLGKNFQLISYWFNPQGIFTLQKV